MLPAVAMKRPRREPGPGRSLFRSRRGSSGWPRWRPSARGSGRAGPRAAPDPGLAVVRIRTVSLRVTVLPFLSLKVVYRSDQACFMSGLLQAFGGGCDLGSARSRRAASASKVAAAAGSAPSRCRSGPGRCGAGCL